jgi:hypothetical protein
MIVLKMTYYYYSINKRIFRVMKDKKLKNKK